MPDPARPAARLDPATLALLRRELEARGDALAFAEAVTLHLVHGPGRVGTPEGERTAATSVLGLLSDPGGEGSVARLASDAELLASFFQNIDLLYAHAYPQADEVAVLVMRALEVADASAGGEEDDASP